MASCTVEGLQDLVARVGLATPIPDFAGGDIVHNPQDILRAYLANTVQKVVDCDRAVAYDAIQPSNSTGSGDLVLVSPRLRLHGVKPKDLVSDLVHKVGVFAFGYVVAYHGANPRLIILSADVAAQRAPFLDSHRRWHSSALFLITEHAAATLVALYCRPEGVIRLRPCSRIGRYDGAGWTEEEGGGRILVAQHGE